MEGISASMYVCLSACVLDVWNKRRMMLCVCFAGKSTILQVEPTYTVADLVASIAETIGRRPDTFRVLFHSRDLTNNADSETNLYNCGIRDSATVDVVLRMCGGMWTEQSGREDYRVGPPSVHARH